MVAQRPWDRQEGGQEERLDVRLLRLPKGSWESLALEGPAPGGRIGASGGVFGGWVSCMASP